MDRAILCFVICLFLLMPAAGWGAYPLITDDADTQGKGKVQVELNTEYDYDRENVAGASVESTGTQATTILSYGAVDTVDLVLTFAYQWAKSKQDGVTVYDEKGIADTTLDVKWRFFEKEGLSLAFKPGLRFATGNDEKGLGAGRTGYQAFMIGSLEADPWEVHANLGYIGNENNVNEVKNIWHASLAVTYEIVKNLKVVGDIGIERNRDRAGNGNPAFLIGGFVYSLFEYWDIDFGVKYGLTAPETDWALLAGTAVRF